MSGIHQPSQDHTAFDAMCAEVQEFEPLPDRAAVPLGARGEDDDEPATPLDERILAGLVSPY